MGTSPEAESGIGARDIIVDVQEAERGDDGPSVFKLRMAFQRQPGMNQLREATRRFLGGSM